MAPARAPPRSRPAPQPPLAEPEIARVLARHARALKGRTTQNMVFEAIRAASELSFDEGLEARGATFCGVARDSGISRTASCVLRRARMRRAFPASKLARAAARSPSRRRDRRRHHGLGHRDVPGGRRHSDRADRTGTRRARARPRRAFGKTTPARCSAAVSTQTDGAGAPGIDRRIVVVRSGGQRGSRHRSRIRGFRTEALGADADSMPSSDPKPSSRRIPPACR